MLILMFLSDAANESVNMSHDKLRDLLAGYSIYILALDGFATVEYSLV